LEGDIHPEDEEAALKTKITMALVGIIEKMAPGDMQEQTWRTRRGRWCNWRARRYVRPWGQCMSFSKNML